MEAARKTTAGKGAAIAWVRHHVNYDSDFCLIFPFYRDQSGYGMLGYNGKQYYAHRLMCEMANGPSPGPGYEATHGCGNGHGGCANPKHLEWKTKVGNRRDSTAHGTGARHHGGSIRSLNEDQIAHMRSLNGQKTHTEIAAMFGVSPPTVRAIFAGKMYAGIPKIKHYTPEEDAQIRGAIDRGLNFTQIAKLLGRNVSAVSGRAYRLGWKSGQPVRKTMP